MQIEPTERITPPASPFETVPLGDLPPTVRLTIAARRFTPPPALRIVLAAAGATVIIALLLALVWPAQAAPPAPPIIAATPTLPALPALEVAAAAPARQIVAHHAPEGAIAGVVLIVDGDPVEIVEQYRGWVRFRAPHMEQPAWVLASDLVGLVDGARLAAAPEIAPTAAPVMATPAPSVVYVQAPTAPPPPRVEPAAPAELVVIEDSAARYVVAVPTVPGQPDAGWGAMGGSGGSWDTQYSSFDCTSRDAAGQPLCVPAAGSGGATTNRENPKP